MKLTSAVRRFVYAKAQRFAELLKVPVPSFIALSVAEVEIMEREVILPERLSRLSPCADTQLMLDFCEDDIQKSLRRSRKYDGLCKSRYTSDLKWLYVNVKHQDKLSANAKASGHWSHSVESVLAHEMVHYAFRSLGETATDERAWKLLREAHRTQPKAKSVSDRVNVLSDRVKRVNARLKRLERHRKKLNRQIRYWERRVNA